MVGAIPLFVSHQPEATNFFSALLGALSVGLIWWGLRKPFGEAGAAKQLSQRADDVASSDAARSGLGKHRREQEEVFVVEQSDRYTIVALEEFLEFERGIETGEAAARDQDASLWHK